VKNFRLIDEHDDQPRGGSSVQVELSSSDSLFAMLDGQIIRGRQAAWRAEIVSIVIEGSETWVQVGRAGSPGSTIVLHMDRQRRAGEALEALRSWTDIPEDSRPGRIELARTIEQRGIERQPVFRELPAHVSLFRSAALRHH
jgi:hypothetical protein